MVEVVVAIVPETKIVYYLSPNSLELNIGDNIIFETDNGLFSGCILKEKYEDKEENLVLPLFNVSRIVEDEDKKKIEKNRIISEKSLRDAKKISRDLDLDMSFIYSYMNFDNSQLILSFLSDNRVDFRELAKKLAQKYKTRIELRQIGVRDKSKKIGGIGPCGLMLCCNSFLTDFNSVSINMAKNQNLSLNPSKINRVCGRLLCCLKYENDNYSEYKKDLPDVGSKIKNDLGDGRVISVDVFKKNYKVLLNNGEIITVEVDNESKK